VFIGGDPCKAGLGLGVYPVGFSGTASGAPSIIAWDFGDGYPKDEDDVDIVAAFPVELGCMGYITMGGGYKGEGLGVYPVGFSGTASGAPSIWWPGDGDGDDVTVVIWNWDEMDIDNLEIGGLMVVWEQPEPGDGSLTDVSITAKGIDEFIMTEHHAYRVLSPAEPGISGNSSGKSGTEYTYEISNNGTQDVYFFIDWGDETPVEYTVESTVPGATATTSHTWSEDGTYK